MRAEERAGGSAGTEDSGGRRIAVARVGAAVVGVAGVCGCVVVVGACADIGAHIVGVIEGVGSIYIYKRRRRRRRKYIYIYIYIQ